MMTIIKFAGFIAILLLVLLGSHYLLYASILRFFSISHPGLMKIIRWLLFFLSLSFFLAAFLLRLHINPFTSFLYITSCLWFGLFLHLLMALVFIWLVFGVGKLVGSVPDMRVVTLGFFLLAMAISVYGVWHAQNPQLKRVEVDIKGLPDHWRNRKIVQLSDVHLGVINRRNFAKRIADRVNGEEPDLVFITGDLFDGMGGHLSSFVEPLNALKASKGIFFVTGNHEGYLGLEKPFAVLKETPIKVLDNEIVEVDGLQIIGISFPEHDQETSVRHLLTQSGLYDDGKPSILLYHTPTNIEEKNTDRANQQSRTYWSPDTSMALAKEVGIDLQLSGHTHKGQLFPFGFQTRAVYNGFDYGLHQDGDFQIYVSSGVGTWGPPMRTGSSSEIVMIVLRDNTRSTQSKARASLR